MAIVKFTKPVTIYDAVESATSDGCTVTTRGESSRSVYVNLQPRALSLRMEPVGTVMDETLIGFCDLGCNINLRDYVSLHGEEPEHQVSSVQIWRTHKSFELKRIV